jgi:hypothetical protein
MTPVGGWVYQAKAWVDEANLNGHGKTMTANFLNFIVALNRVFIQDVATMMIQFPERATHPVFYMELFRLVKFQVSPSCFMIVFVALIVVSNAFSDL